MSREEITHLIKTNPQFTVAALLAIFSFQEADEQNSHTTKYVNSKGFNGTDAYICTDLVRFYRSRGFLTPRQLEVLRKCLPKYMGQIEGWDLQPVPFKSTETPAPTTFNQTQPVNTKKAVLLPDGLIHISFTFDSLLVAKVKTLSDRRWDSIKKEWTSTPSPETITKLTEWGFELCHGCQEWLQSVMLPAKPEKKYIDFFLCPLYNNIYGVGKNKNIGENHAIGSLCQNETNIGENERELGKGSRKSSERKSSQNNSRNITNSGMERESIGSDKRSNASTGCQGKAYSSINISKRETRDQFQRGEWSGTGRNSEEISGNSGTNGICNGISDSNIEGAQHPKCTKCIQSRLWKSENENSNRSGRASTQQYPIQKVRSEENENIGEPWLDCDTLQTLTINSKGVKKQLFPYQIEGVNFIDSRNGRCLIADSMGLGKTAQALSWLQLHPEARPAIIVCPASLKLNWAREAEMWMTNPKCQIINGRPNGIPLTGEIIIINYDIASDWLEKIKAYKPAVVVTDEVHYLKNSKALRTKAIKEMAKGVPHFIALSGTPIVNRPNEIYNAISFIQPKLFPSYFKFAQRYCGATHNGFGWDFNGASNTEELHKILTDTIMIRRKKADVLKDLPPKMRNVVPMLLENDKEYRRAEADFISWLRYEFGKEKADAAKRAEALVRINHLKQLAVKGKFNACMEWVSDFLETGEKLVIFAHHKEVVDSLMNSFGNKAVKVVGGVTIEDRQKAVDRFQNDDSCRVFVGSKAAKEGLTLTKSSNTCFIELWWTPGDHDQAEDRVHRIGQQAESVNAWYLLTENTIEQEMAQLIDSKRQVLSRVLDGEDVSEDSMLNALLNKYMEKEA